MATGIRKLHSTGCPGKEGGRCGCNAGYEASVFSKRDGKKIRKTFTREAEAKTWRAGALSSLSRGGLRVTKPTTVDEAWEAWINGARAGTVTNRSGDPFKPSALRSYERAMRLRVLPEFGDRKLAEVYQPDLQEFADGLLSDGLNPSTIQVTLNPLRAMFRRAISRGEVATNPCSGLQLAAVRAQGALRDPGGSRGPDRGCTGLRSPHMGYRDVRGPAPRGAAGATGRRRRHRQWCDPRRARVGRAGGRNRTEDDAGRRKVPISAILRDFLAEHLVQVDREGADRIFGATTRSPFAPRS